MDAKQLAEERLALQRAIAIRDAREHLLPFAKLMRPHPQAPGDVTQSKYTVTPLHAALASAAERVESGDIKRLILNVPPRHGKSEMMSKIFPAWFAGRDPFRSVILATYNDGFAEDYGRAVRGFMQSNAYAQVFPDSKLAKGSAASDKLVTVSGGQLSFVGINGTITGRGGDLLLIDDPLKGTEESQSATIRNKLWHWFTNDLMSRFMSDQGVVILTQTRWHDDDLVGRLTDPSNPHYNEEEAALWKIINIPAIAEDDDPLGRAKGEALWPGRFGLPYLESRRRMNPVSFSALYQQRPSPEDGIFFTRALVEEFSRIDLPPREELNFYMSVDLAVAQTQVNDKSVILVVAVDCYDNIYLVDCAWERMDTVQIVDKIISFVKTYDPAILWGEKDHIFKSIGPFLYKRLREERLFSLDVQEVTTHQDKMKKAQAIKGRMAMKMVKFPRYATWVGDAIRELLKFPAGTHDDFVDALANVGRGLNDMLKGGKPPSDEDENEKYTGPRPGSFGHMKHQTALRERRERAAFSRADD